ncbi:MAG: sulfotransferase [Fidelibacterota bacterium]
MKTTTPIFVVGSGRNGTRMIYKLLSGFESIESHHEYMCTHIQPWACKYFMGKASEIDIKDVFSSLHGTAIHYSSADIWLDCSNKLSWIIPPIFELFPNAVFIHLVRDGRKVANSYYRKLTNEIYDDHSVHVLQEWVKFGIQPEPPPEKKYWWNIPQSGYPFYKEFPTFNQFERCCYQWVESNRVILEAMESIPNGQKWFVRLEELISKKDLLTEFLSIFSLPFDEDLFEFLQIPQNVIFPMDFTLTEEQRIQFYAIGGDMMRRLGYNDGEEYVVRY